MQNVGELQSRLGKYTKALSDLKSEKDQLNRQHGSKLPNESVEKQKEKNLHLKTRITVGENESAAFWTTIFNELKNRGVKDILIACHDNLSGFSNALSTVFPKTENQLCIIHMIRNSTKFVSYKDIKPIMADLKKVYGAVNEEAALYALEEFKEKWDSKYPQIYKMWESNWTDLSGFFKYPTEMRRLIYTTNAVEGFHRMLRKFTKTKTNFPTDDSLKKSIYLSVKEISKKWNNPVRDWGKIIGQFMMFFEERFGEIRTA